MRRMTAASWTNTSNATAVRGAVERSAGVNTAKTQPGLPLPLASGCGSPGKVKKTRRGYRRMEAETSNTESSSFTSDLARPAPDSGSSTPLWKRALRVVLFALFVVAGSLTAAGRPRNGVRTHATLRSNR